MNKSSFRGVGIWEHFTVQDGLPDMKIECLYEDRDHQLWIGTHDRGLARYTGDGFEHFTRRDGLAGDGVYSALEDKDGRLWLGTNGGLSCIEDGHIKQVGQLEGRGLLWGSCVDGTGALWFGLDGERGQLPALCCWRGGQLEVVDLPGGKLEIGEGIEKVVPDGEGGFWCCGSQFYHYTEGVFEKIEEIQYERGSLVDFVVHDSGSLWLTMNEGLYSFDKSGLNLIAPYEARDWIAALRTSSDGLIWAGMRDGRLMVFEEEIPKEVGRIDGPMGRGMCIDYRGRVWLGTYGMGLFCFDETRLGYFRKEQGLPDDHVHCVLADSKNRLWTGTRKGLVYFDGTKITQPIELDYIAQREITSIVESKEGLFLMGARNGILMTCDLQAQESQDLNIDDALGYGISHVLEDLENNIWFGFKVGQGVGVWDGEQLKHWGPQEQDRYPLFIGGMALDVDGSILIGSAKPTSLSGLYKLNAKECKLVDDLQKRPVLALCRDSSGRIWVGTNEGVLCFDGEDVTHLRQEDGLPCELITVLFEGKGGIIWIGTEGGGLCWHDGNVLQVVQIPREPGLNVIRGIAQDSRGQIWCATQGGLLRFSPEQSIPQIKIQHVVAGRTFNANDKIHFPTTVGRVDFSFTGNTPLESSSYLVYRYRLLGLHTTWKQTRQKAADYFKLSPGDYTFEVQSVDRDGNYSDIATVNFQVTEDPVIAGFNEVLSGSVSGMEIIGDGPKIKEIKEMVREVAKTDLSVFILGETGTGKGLIAQAIHEMSNRRGKPFISVNCGSLSSLVDSELFGHEKGAFTSAVSQRLGRFELAEGGTIFLDEIGDMPIDAQIKLLRVLQERVIERVGGNKLIKIDVRVIAATNRDIAQAVREGEFRQDLFYRLHVYPLKMPALRERKEDIPQLVEYFATNFARHLDLPVRTIPPGVIEDFLTRNWLGNVRELEYAVQRVVLGMQNKEIKLQSFDHIMEINEGGFPNIVGENLEFVSYAEFETNYLKKVLDFTNGQIHGEKGAAKLLNLKPTTLRSRLKKLGIEMGTAYRERMR